jgi:hypothetical protein
MPAESKSATAFGYSRTVKASVHASTKEDIAKVGSNNLAFASEALDVPGPSAKLSATPAKVIPGAKLKYETVVSVGANGFCGAKEKWVYKWKRTTNGKPNSLVPPAAGANLVVQLGSGDTEEFVVTVQDEWGVELALDTLKIQAPVLGVDIETKCADGQSIELPSGNPPGGWSQTAASAKPPAQTLCKEIVLVADTGLSPGVGTTFPTVAIDPKIDWKVEYATSPKWDNWASADKWRDKGKLTVKYKGDRYAFAPNPAQTIVYRATVSVQDQKWGGLTAATSVKESNESSTPQQIAGYLKELWFWARDLKMPEADPCGLRCGGGKPGTDDWLAQDISQALWNLKVTPASRESGRALERLTSKLKVLSARAIGKTAKERGLPFKPPSFIGGLNLGKAASFRKVDESAQTTFQKKALQQMKKGPAFTGMPTNAFSMP